MVVNMVVVAAQLAAAVRVEAAMVEAAEVLAAMWANPIQGPLPSRSDLIRPHPRRTGHLLRPRMPARSSRSSRASPCPPTRAERIGRRVGRSDRPSRDFCRDETERLEQVFGSRSCNGLSRARTRRPHAVHAGSQFAKKGAREHAPYLLTPSQHRRLLPSFSPEMG